MAKPPYIQQAEQAVTYSAQDTRRAKKVVVDTRKLFEKKLQQLTFDQLNGTIDFDEQFKRQNELMALKTKIEEFSGSVGTSDSSGSSDLSMDAKKEMHHLANSGLYTQEEVAEIFDSNQAQVSRYKNKPSSYFDK
ncbi:hypothetical protein [Vibrio fluvialis]|uniref:hypothetical protein n=1 Tax=Vibrio fluvialis TaxID=676 RepID=UPI002ACA05EC|nr:hypothetical protein [Vibrio fluvialis]MDZ5516646.1 hypothetical protein [Vibrio fluvialis]